MRKSLFGCVRYGSGGSMKRIALALCLAAATATAQAQTADERAAAPKRHSAASRHATTPSPVSALLKWLHDKSQPSKTARTERRKATAKVAEEPKPAPTRTEAEVKPEVAPEATTEANAEPQRELRPRETRHRWARRHREKPPVDDTASAPPVITMTLASAPPAAPETKPAPVVSPPAAPAASAAAPAPAAAIANPKAAVAAPPIRSRNPAAAAAAAPVVEAPAVAAP